MSFGHLGARALGCTRKEVWKTGYSSLVGIKGGSGPWTSRQRGFFSRLLGKNGDKGKEADRLKRSKAIRDEMQAR